MSAGMRLGVGVGAGVEVETGTDSGRSTCCSTATGPVWTLEATGCGLAALELTPPSDASRSRTRHQPAPRRTLDAGICGIDEPLDA